MMRFPRIVVWLVWLTFLSTAFAQDGEGVPVSLSEATQTLNGRDYLCHVVQRGQTVYSIARAYGVSYTSAITRTDIHQLHVGDTVWIPATSAARARLGERTKLVRVEPKQTLYGLSRQYGMTVDELLDINPQVKGRSLQAGEYIVVPASDDDFIESGEEQFGMGAYEYTAPSRPNGSNVSQRPKAAAAKKAEPVEAEVFFDTVGKNSLPVAVSLASAGTPAAAPDEAETTAAPEAAVNPVASTRPADLPSSSSSQSIPAAETAATQKTATTQEAAVASTRSADLPSSSSSQGVPAEGSGATAGVFPFPVHDRVSPNKLYISLLMPLNLESMDKISTTKFDVDQRGKREYKVFEMLQFYEGMLLATEELKRKGYNIVLNVVDIPGGAATAVEGAYTSHDVSRSDFIIALLERDAFAVAARLASNDKVFIINPVSLRSEIVTNAPYVIKMQPSPEGTVSNMLDIVAQMGTQLYIIHSGGKLEKSLHDEFQRQLAERPNIQYTWFDWAVNGKLGATLKQSTRCAVISIYDQGKDKNRIFCNLLINRLIAAKSTDVTLMTFANWLTEYTDIDYSHLQRLSYHTLYPYYLDYSNETHKAFIEQFKETYKTEPSGRFAGMGHDVMLYFASGLHSRGAAFWKNCATPLPDNMLFPLHFRQQGESDGFENQLAPIYRMRNLQIEKVK